MKNKEDKTMWKDFLELDGILETPEEINKAVTDLTLDPEPMFDTDSDDWKMWVEYRDGKTIILQDGV